MKNLFGTDGIRGKVNESILTADLALRVGQSVGKLAKNKRKVIIGKDTRISKDMLESALVSGLTSVGCDVYLVGVCPTPCISFLLESKDFDFGIMISASHNVYSDNGIKIFENLGEKLSFENQIYISKLVSSGSDFINSTNEDIGKVFSYQKGLISYLESLAQIKLGFKKLKLALDCANGSASATYKKAFNHAGIELYVMANTPNGININADCGSTKPEHLAKFVVEKGCDLGFAFDGDADRVIAVDHKGNIVDGDKLMYLLAVSFKERGLLKENTLVTTKMSNIGLYKALDNKGIAYVKTDVGDKYVFQELKAGGFVLGGEQSGHIIVGSDAKTGDGQFVALKILEVLQETNQRLDTLVKDVKIFPQILLNIPVKNKYNILHNDVLNERVLQIESELATSGRVLLRASGTEELIRIMVEAETTGICKRYVSELESLVEELNNTETSF